MTLRGVLFDFTDTLAELEEEVGFVYARVAAEFDFEVPAEDVTTAFRAVMRDRPRCHFPEAPRDRVPELERAWWHEVVERTFRAARCNVRFAKLDACFEVLFEFYASSDAWRLRPGALRLLRQLRSAAIPSGIVSNFDHRLPHLLQGLEIMELLDSVQIPSRCGASKPEPAIFEAAARDLGEAPEHLVYLGHDPRIDHAGARAAGLRALDARRIPSLEELAARLGETLPSPA